MTDAAARLDLEQCDAPVGSQVLQFLRFLPIDPADGTDLSGELRVQVGVESSSDKKKNARGKNAYDECQHAGVPNRKSSAHAQLWELHACLPLKMYPRPRTVCSSFLSYGSSTLRRNRAIVTSMTLSSGVALIVACPTSRASISRDTTLPLWRMRYSSSSNSLAVSSRP